MSKFTDVEQLNWSDRPYLRWLTLFVSGGTLICCALPIVLVTMGFLRLLRCFGLTFGLWRLKTRSAAFADSG